MSLKHGHSSFYIMAIGAALLFGASAPLIKLMLNSMEPVMLAGILYMGSGIGMALVKAFQRTGNTRTSEASLGRGDISWLLAALVVGGITAPIILMFGIDNTPASTAALLLNFEAVGTVLIARLMFREQVGRGVWMALFLITLGSILLSINSTDGWGLSLGALTVLAACFLWGLDNNLTRNISAKDPIMIVTIKGLGAGLFSIALAIAIGNDFPELSVIVIALFIGFLCYGLSLFLYIRALRGLGAARTGALFGTAPFSGGLLGLLIFHDSITIWLIVALPLLIFGTILMFKEAHEHSHKHTAESHEHRHAHDDRHHDHSHEGPEPKYSHSHFHSHGEVKHEHHHMPDIHHRHEHKK